MSDVALRWNADALAADFAIIANDLSTDEGMETAVFLSLFIDREAEPGDVLPDGETDRRGWWADAEPVVPNDKIGSRLWLLNRSKETPDVLDRAAEYSRQALRWLIDDKVSDRVDVVAEFVSRGVLGLLVTIYRPNRDPVSFRFNHTWEAQGV